MKTNVTVDRLLCKLSLLIIVIKKNNILYLTYSRGIRNNLKFDHFTQNNNISWYRYYSNKNPWCHYCKLSLFFYYHFKKSISIIEIYKKEYGKLNCQVGNTEVVICRIIVGRKNYYTCNINSYILLSIDKNYIIVADDS